MSDAKTSPSGTSIHNIGYRHYDGPRLGRSYAAKSLFVHSLRGAYGLGRSAKSKVLPMLLLVIMCLPALIITAIAVINATSDELPLEYTRYAIYLQAVLTLFVSAQAPQLVSRDLRFRTVPLYFSRPIERLDYVVAKFAATVAALFVLLAVPLVILYAGALLAKFPVGTQTKDFALSLVAAAALALLYAGLGLLVAALTPRRGFGVAAIIALFTIPYGAVSTLQEVADTNGNDTAAGWLGLFSPITLFDGMQSWALGATSAAPEGPPGHLGGLVFLLVLLGLVAGSFGLLIRRYRKVGLS
ncbi:ABC transporter permease [Streptomyces capparidis]